MYSTTDNLEDLFSLIDMSCQFGEKGAKAARKALIRLACRTIELAVIVRNQGIDSQKHLKGNHRKMNHCGDDEYLKLALWLKKRMRRNSIITLNYDALMEQALEDVIHKQSFTYGDPWHKPIDQYQIKVLKLHGSINWGICSKFKSHTWAEKTISLTSTTRQPDIFHMNPSSKIYRMRCPRCQSPERKLEPFIVPPTWNKGSYGRPLQQVWKGAFEEIKQATRLIIIGYSLPETDSYFKYLLATSLSENRPLQQIIVVDPAGGVDTKESSVEKRYREFLAPNFVRRNFTFHKMDFQQWLDQKLRDKDTPE